MGAFRRDSARRHEPSTVAGRAYVVPASTRNLPGNEDNMSPDGASKSEIHLVAVSAADGRPFAEQMQRVTARIPNWLVIVFHDAGSNHGIAESLPARLEVDVTIDAATRTITGVDVDAASREHARHRDAAVDHWKHTESVFAPVRNVIKAPSMVRKGIKGLLKELKDVKSEIAGIAAPAGTPPKPSWTEQQVDELMRTANILGHRFQLHPDERQRARTAALTALPMRVDQIKAGAIHRADFDALVRYEVVSTAITQDEADQYYRDAGLA